MADALATQNNGGSFTVSLRNSLASEIGKTLPDEFNVDKFVHNAVALLNSDSFKNIVNWKRQNPNSDSKIIAALVQSAIWGLDIMNKEVYLVPYGSSIQCTPSYMGLVKLAKKLSYEPIKSIDAYIVREGESFNVVLKEGQPTVNHVMNPFGNGEIIGVYAIAVFRDGSQKVATMSKKEIDAAKNASKAKFGPWVTWFEEMAKKSVIRRLCKNITIDSENGQNVIDFDPDDIYGGGSPTVTVSPIDESQTEIIENENAEEAIFEEITT